MNRYDLLACLIFLCVGLFRSSKVQTEEAYLFQTLNSFKDRFGKGLSQTLSLFVITSFLLLSTITLKAMTAQLSSILPKTPTFLLSAYLTLLSILILWRGGFLALVRVAFGLFVTFTYCNWYHLEDINFTLFLISGFLILGCLWNILTVLTLRDFLKAEPKESFIRVGCISLIYTSLTYLFASLIPTESLFTKFYFACVPCIALSFSILGLFWRRASLTGVYASVFITLFWGFFSFVYFKEIDLYLVPISIFVGMGASFLFPDKKLEV